MRGLGVVCIACMITACGGGASADAGLDAETDASVHDAGLDAGAHDAGLDAGAHDAGLDAGAHDAATDAGTDAATDDAATGDAATGDATADAATDDAATDDAAIGDAAADGATVDAAIVDAAIDAATDAGDGGGCSIAGEWTRMAPFGLQFWMRFDADTEWRYTNDPTFPDSAVIGRAMWSTSGTQLSLGGMDPHGMLDECDTLTDVFEMSFSADCNMVTLTTITDGCMNGRADGVAQVWTRVP